MGPVGVGVTIGPGVGVGGTKTLIGVGVGIAVGGIGVATKVGIGVGITTSTTVGVGKTSVGPTILVDSTTRGIWFPGVGTSKLLREIVGGTNSGSLASPQLISTRLRISRRNTSIFDLIIPNKLINC